MRTLVNDSCLCVGNYTERNGVCVFSLVCDSGFEPASATTCQEVCGDGRLFVLSCDDGNLLSGDGCSDKCQIE